MEVKSKWGRILSMLLCCVMLMGILPTMVSAAPVLLAPTNLRWEGTTAKWDNPNGAEVVKGIKVEVFNKKDVDFAASFIDTDGTLTEFDCSRILIPGDTYYFKVSFHGDDEVFGEAVQSGDYTVPGSYTVSGIENLQLGADGKMTWTPKPYVTSYSALLEVKNGDSWEDASGSNWVAYDATSYTWGASNMKNGAGFEDGKTYRASLIAKQGPIVVGSETFTDEYTHTTAPAQYTVVFKANGYGGDADGNMLTLLMTEGSTIKNTLDELPADAGWDKICPEPTVESDKIYELDGYYKTSACAEGDRYDYDTAITGDLTLYANWNKIDYYGIRIDSDTRVTENNKDDILGDGTASYDPETNILTLKEYKGSDIHAEGALTIKLADGTSNVITIPETSGEDGILTGGACTLTGGGNLTIDACANGIYAESGDITINGSGNIKITVRTRDGIHASEGRVYIGGSGNLTIEAVDEGIQAEYELRVSGSGDISITTGDDGFYVLSGGVVIDGSGNIAITSSGDEGIDVNGDTGHVLIEGSGSLTIDADDNGICADAEIEISGSGDVTVKAKDHALCSYEGRLVLSGSGSVTVEAETGYAVNSNYAGNAVEINGIGSPLSFKAGSNVDSTAVYNEDPAGTLVGGDTFYQYSMTGDPAGKTVTYTRDQTDISLPIEKTVVKEGEVAPGQTVFTFELLRAVGEDENANLNFEVIATAQYAMNGQGVGRTKLTFKLPPELLGQDGGFTEPLYLREKQNAGEGWTYSDVVYMVGAERVESSSTPGSGTIVYYFFNNNDPDQGQEPGEFASFVNTYKKNKEPISPEYDKKNITSKPNSPRRAVPIVSRANIRKSSPRTGDSGAVFMWMVLLFVSLGALTTTVAVRKKDL